MKHVCFCLFETKSLQPRLVWNSERSAGFCLPRAGIYQASLPSPQIIKKKYPWLRKEIQSIYRRGLREFVLGLSVNRLGRLPLISCNGPHLPCNQLQIWPEILCISQQNKLSPPLLCFLSSPFDFHRNENVQTPKEMQNKLQQPSWCPRLRLEWLDENRSVPLQPPTQAGEQPYSLLLAA